MRPVGRRNVRRLRLESLESRVMLSIGQTTGTPAALQPQAPPQWVSSYEPGILAGSVPAISVSANIVGYAASTATDIQLPGIGLSLDFRRYYQSRSTADVGMGTGWVNSYSDYLTFGTGGTITWTDNQGASTKFTPNGQGGYQNPAGTYGTFSKTASGYAYRAPEGLVHSFNSQGHLVQIADRNGNALNVTYNASAQLSTVTEADAPERALAFTYSGSHITAISDGTGRTWSYTYNGNQLVQVTAPAAVTVHYAYYSANGLLDQVTDPDGGLTQFTYDGYKRVVTLTNPGGFTDKLWYSSAQHQTLVTDARGYVTTYTFDSQGDVISVRHPDNAQETYTWQNGVETAFTDALGHTQSYRYDATGNVTKATDAMGNVTTATYNPTFGQMTNLSQPGNRVTQVRYDSRGNPLEVIDAAGDVTTMTYDSHGLTLTQTRPKGNLAGASAVPYTMTYAYDDAGDELSVSTGLSTKQSFTYDTRGDRLTSTDARGNTTTYGYDALGRLTQTKNPLGGASTYAYDAMGVSTATTDALGRTTTFVYDARHNLVKRVNPDGTSWKATYDATGNMVSQTDDLGRTTRMTYDSRDRLSTTTFANGSKTSLQYNAAGQETTSTDARGNTTTFTYDALGRLIQTTDPLGDVTTNAYDAAGNLISVTDPSRRTTSFGYDLLGRRTTVTDPPGHATTTAYDADGNVVSVTDPLGHVTQYGYDAFDQQTSGTDALRQVTTTTYDASGNVLSITDAAGNVTSYSYDALGRKISQTDSLGATQTYAYDAAGNLTSYTDADGRTTRYTYDARNRKTSEQWLAANGTPVRVISYAYDADSELTAQSDPESSYTYKYNLMGRLTSVDNKGTLGLPDVALSYTYDAAGNALTCSYTINGTAGATQSMTYNVLGRETQITETGSGVAAERVNFAYDAAGELMGMIRYADLAGTALVAATSYGYDGAGRLTQQTDSQGTTTLAQYAWTVDAVGRVTQETSLDGTNTYAYDADNQLTSASSTYLPAESYSYDANGNRTGKGIQTGKDNQLLSDGTYNYAYDKDGNLVQRTEIATGDVTHYTWDYRNRLTQVVSKNAAGQLTQEADYTYDVNNQRITKSVDPDGAGPLPATVQRFVYSGGQIAMQFSASGAVTHRCLYGPGVDRILADDAGGVVSWALADRLGSVRNLVSSAGAVTDHLEYNSFGRLVSESQAATDFLFGYAGGVLDRETGLQYDNARYYDPSSGRFLSQDPLSFSAGDANLYRYVGNHPTNATDPSGLQCGVDGDALDGADSNAVQLASYEQGSEGQGWADTASSASPTADNNQQGGFTSPTTYWHTDPDTGQWVPEGPTMSTDPKSGITITNLPPGEGIQVQKDGLDPQIVLPGQTLTYAGYPVTANSTGSAFDMNGQLDALENSMKTWANPTSDNASGTLATPGVINWLVATARDASLFDGGDNQSASPLPKTNDTSPYAPTTDSGF
jgi:RHS repeat-associated protein